MAQRLKFFVARTVSVVCGMTAGATDSKTTNQPITFESNRNCPIQSFAGP